jgi:hypothetical protein
VNAVDPELEPYKVKTWFQSLLSTNSNVHCYVEVLDPNKLVVLERRNGELARRVEAAEAAAAEAETRRAAAVDKEEAFIEAVSSLRLQRDEAVVEAARWKARAEEAAAAVRHMETNMEAQMAEWKAAVEAEAAAAATPEDAEKVATTTADGGENNVAAAVTAAAPASDRTHARNALSSSVGGHHMRWISSAGGGGGGLGALEAAAEEEATIRVLIDALPRVALHVLIQHRVELLPLFQRAIARCPVPTQRAGTTALLFSLIKRPGPDQRRVLADACANIARVVGEQRTADELIPQCFEQVTHKHEERRLLVAETCGRLAPHVGEGLRSSLLLTMLQQQAEDDPSSAVREGVVRNLVSLLEADPDVSKAHTVEALLLQLSLDSTDEVSELTVLRMLPAVSSWLLRRGGAHRVHANLLPAVASRLLQVLGRAALAEGGFRPLAEDDRWRAGVLLRLFTGLLPAVRQAAARSVPPSLAAEEKEGRGAVAEAAGAAAGAAAVVASGEAGSANASEKKEAQEEEEGAARADDSAVDAALARFAASPRGTHTWPAAEWLTGDGVALIAALARAAPPSEEGTRRATIGALKSYCLVVGEAVTATCVAPVMAAAAGVVVSSDAVSGGGDGGDGGGGSDGDGEGGTGAAAAAAMAAAMASSSLRPAAWALLAPPTMPASAAAAALARTTALPLFLVAVLPHAGTGALTEYLRGFVTCAINQAALAAAAAGVAGVGLGSVGLPDDVLGAVNFVASFEPLQGPLLGLLGELSGSGSVAVRSGAAALLGAAAGAVSEEFVTRRALPVLASLRGDRDEECQRYAAEAFAAVAEAHPTQATTTHVAAQLDVLLEARKPGLTLAVVAALEGAGRCPGTPYCLHAAQCLAAVARRETMAAIAAGGGGADGGDGDWVPRLGEALFASVQSVLGSDDGTQGLHAVLAPALQALLSEDASFLDTSERSLAEVGLSFHTPRRQIVVVTWTTVYWLSSIEPCFFLITAK